MGRWRRRGKELAKRQDAANRPGPGATLLYYRDLALVTRGSRTPEKPIMNNSRKKKKERKTTDPTQNNISKDIRGRKSGNPGCFSRRGRGRTPAIQPEEGENVVGEQKEDASRQRNKELRRRGTSPAGT